MQRITIADQVKYIPIVANERTERMLSKYYEDEVSAFQTCVFIRNVH